VLASQSAQQIRQTLRILDHRVVTAQELDRLDAEQLSRHEAVPLRLENLVFGRVDQHGWDVGMARQKRQVMTGLVYRYLQ